MVTNVVYDEPGQIALITGRRRRHRVRVRATPRPNAAHPDHRLLEARLRVAVEQLQAEGLRASTIICDVTDTNAVNALADNVSKKGELASIVHTAGISPSMTTDPRRILEVNLIGTAIVLDSSTRWRQLGPLRSASPRCPPIDVSRRQSSPSCSSLVRTTSRTNRPDHATWEQE